MTTDGVPALSRNGRHSEAGETLVEVLITVVIISLAVVALLGSLLTSAGVSATHRYQTTLAAQVSSFTDAARTAVETSANGPEFSTTCTASFPYQIVGAPYPRSGPPGTQVAVLGTGFVTGGGGTYTGANVAGTLVASQPLLNSASSSSGAITGLTIPAIPAGSYQLYPFDGSHAAASPFTVTPAVGAMAPTGSGNVTVALSGFGKSATISTVTVGGAAATIISGSAVSPAGVTTLVFKPPTTTRVVLPVIITDNQGNASQSVNLSIADRTSTASPVASTSLLTDSTFAATLSYSDPTTTPPWTTDCTDPNINTNIQLLSFVVKDFRAGSGSSASSTVAVSNFTSTKTPTAPASFKPVAGNGTVTLGWSAPGYLGTSAITGYRLYRSTTSGAQGTLIASPVSGSTSYTDSSVSNGTTYYYEIAAVNGSGTGSYSAQVSATPAGPPSAPLNVTPTAGDTKVALTWNPPTTNGGSAVTDYTVLYGTSAAGPYTSIDTGGTATSYTVTGLTNGTSYYFEVQAANAVSSGTTSAPVSCVPARAPGAPTGLAATAGSGAVTLHWTAPASNGGSAISQYTVLYGTSAGSLTSSINTGTPVTTYTVPGLTGGTTYWFEVEADNSVGPSTPSNEVSATPTTPPVPGAPTLSTATAGDGQVSLVWTAPTTGGTPSDYIVLVAPVSTGIFTSTDTHSTALNYTVTGLVDGTPYYFKVQATNASGSGAPSNQKTATPQAMPGTPTLQSSVTAGGGNGNGQRTATLTWAAPTSGGTVTDYIILYSKSSTGPFTQVDVGGTALTYTVNGLDKTTYYFEVEASDNGVTGPVSNQVSVGL